MKRIITLRLDNEEFTVTAHREEDAIIVEREGVTHTVHVLAEHSSGESASAAGTATEKRAPRPVAAPSPTPAPSPVAAQPVTTGGAESVGEGVAAAVAPMTGVVKELLVSEGETVTEGQRVVMMEAMKMDVYVNAPVGGTVKGVHAKAGDAVNSGATLVTVEKGEA